jgi:predicted heme/steroid binding protein
MKHLARISRLPQKARAAIKRYPLVFVALLLAVGLVGGAAFYVNNRNQAAVASQQNFDPSSVLPQPVPQPEATTIYTAASIKDYDGQNGHKCYVAVKDTVYEIKDNAYWKDGKHTPSGGRGYCGGDMTEIIKQSPHGESVLESLPKVGIYKNS